MIAVAAASVALPPERGRTAPASDDYLEGYAAAILERELRLSTPSLRVKDAVVFIDPAELGNADPDDVRRALASIPGVTEVRILSVDATRGARTETSAGGLPPERASRTRAAASELGFLPRGQLFEPLLADPRWPRFSAVYRYYIDDDELGNVGAANFGATVPLYRARSFPAWNGLWETGFQAAVFSIFDLDADSKDLINSDFFVALFGSHRVGDLSVIGSVLHQSSHLGDEFLLRNRTERVNLSYEGLDLKLSYDVLTGTRVYGGGTFLFDQEPADLDPWVVQYGIEIASPWSFAGGAVTPVAAADFHNTQESNWRTQFSVLGGLRLERLRIADSAILLGAEWFQGRSPNGQFYGRSVEWFGVGAHLYF